MKLLGAAEVGVLGGLRWWTLAELEQTGEEVFAPADLPALARGLIEEGLPERPVAVGV